MKWIQRKPRVMPTENDSIEEKIAKMRGIKDIQRFLNPTIDEMFDPYLIKNIEEASNRIIRAIKNGEKIVVSYDPDADGIASGTIMIRECRHYTDKVDFVYGERGDGHGIAEMIKELGDEISDRVILNTQNRQKIADADLLIIVDSSSNDAEACEKIRSWGTDIVILDHHEIENENPHVLLVNPQQEGDEYPNKQLSGAGVVFKTIQVMEDTLGEVDPFYFMDLVAVGMYGDMMRVDVLENRYMIMHGLRNVNNAGLLRILKGAKADMYKLNGDSIGFSIAPLINGVARLDNIKLAIDILLEDDDKVCMKTRLKMHKLNEKRKEMQKEIFDRYSKSVDLNNKILFIVDEHSSKGFNGLICQQLSDKYKRPAIVGRLHKGKFSGSFRSFNGFDLKTFLQESGFVEEAMGHKQAGGITVSEGNIDNLIKFIEDNIPEMKDREQTSIYDVELDVSEVAEYVKVLEQFNMLAGNGFPKVIAKVNNITVEGAECIGKTRETVKIKTFDDMELIKFRVNENYASELGYFDTINVVGQLQINEWYNFAIKKKIVIPQVMIEDYQLN